MEGRRGFGLLVTPAQKRKGGRGEGGDGGRIVAFVWLCVCLGWGSALFPLLRRGVGMLRCEGLERDE